MPIFSRNNFHLTVQKISSGLPGARTDSNGVLCTRRPWGRGLGGLERREGIGVLLAEAVVAQVQGHPPQRRPRGPGDEGGEAPVRSTRVMIQDGLKLIEFDFFGSKGITSLRPA